LSPIYITEASLKSQKRQKKLHKMLCLDNIKLLRKSVLCQDFSTNV